VVDEPDAVPFVAHRPATEGDPLDLYRRAERPAHPGRPWVLSNFVAGIDGAIAIDGRVDGLSSPSDQEVFDLLRSLADVVLVGAGTFRAERYPPVRLSERLRAEREARGQPPVPGLAVVSRSLQLDWERPSFTQAQVRPIVVTSAASDPGTRERASQVADVLVAGDEHVDVAVALEALHERGHRVVLCEGGAALLAELLAGGLLDELCLTISPLVGGDPSRIVADQPRPPLTRFELAQVLTAGHELYLRYLLRGDSSPRERGESDG
jgi:riboflavin biosynthesis pyrimidine reductase